MKTGFKADQSQHSDMDDSFSFHHIDMQSIRLLKPVYVAETFFSTKDEDDRKLTGFSHSR